MFRKGDYMMHGNVGVCLVKDVGSIDFLTVSKERMYYTLLPYYTKGSVIFTPADNQKVVMRPIMTAKEAKALLDYVGSAEISWLKDEKKREEEYKEAIRSCDTKKLGMTIKEIAQFKRKRILQGKRIPSGEERYYRRAEDMLYGELALVLDMERREIRNYFLQSMKNAG